MSEHAVPDHPAFRSKHPGPMTFEKVLVFLAIVTLIEVIVSTLYSDKTIGLAIAAFLLVFFAFSKAITVAGYFMHIFYEKRPFTIFMIAFGFPMMIAAPIALVALSI